MLHGNGYHDSGFGHSFDFQFCTFNRQFAEQCTIPSFDQAVSYLTISPCFINLVFNRQQSDRWGQVPGKFGYQYKRTVKVSDPLPSDDLKSLCGAQQQSSSGWTYDFDVERQFFNLTYQPTESVVNYQK